MNAMRVSSFVYVKFCGTNGNKVSGIEVVAVWGDCKIPRDQYIICNIFFDCITTPYLYTMILRILI